ICEISIGCFRSITSKLPATEGLIPSLHQLCTPLLSDRAEGYPFAPYGEFGPPAVGRSEKKVLGAPDESLIAKRGPVLKSSHKFARGDHFKRCIHFCEGVCVLPAEQILAPRGRGRAFFKEISAAAARSPIQIGL